MPRRLGQLLSTFGRAARRVAGRHYPSLISAVLLAGFAVFVLSSDGWDSRKSDSPAITGASNSSPAAPTDQPSTRRLSVLFYVVNDTAQRDELAAALHADRLAFAAGVQPTDFVVYLIAGTRQEEEETIARLNFEEAAARQSNVDMRVIDVRGRFE